MEFSPFFEPEGMSDEDLNNKLTELRKRFMIAQSGQSSYQLVQGIQSMIQAIEQEQSIRYQIQAQASWSKMFPDVIESDPAAKAKQQEEAQKVAGKPGPKKRLATTEIFHKEYIKPDKKPGTK